MMRDPINFPDPENFLPDRFSDEKPNYNPDAFLPFGDGPRACIGMEEYESVFEKKMKSIKTIYQKGF